MCSELYFAGTFVLYTTGKTGDTKAGKAGVERDIELLDGPITVSDCPKYFVVIVISFEEDIIRIVPSL